MLHLHWAIYLSPSNWTSLVQITKWLMDQSISVQCTHSFNGCPITNETRRPIYQFMDLHDLDLILHLSWPQCLSNQPAETFAPFKCNHCSLWTTGTLASRSFMQPVVHSHKHMIWFLLNPFNPQVSGGPQTSRNRMEKKKHTHNFYQVLKEVHSPTKKFIMNADALSLTQPISTHEFTCLLKHLGQCVQS